MGKKTNHTDQVQKKPALGVSTADLLDRFESFDLELKRNIKAVEAKFLVSFANSSTGGVILAGVDEETDSQGKKFAKVCGTVFGDEQKRTLQSRADQCRPSVKLRYSEEEIDGNDVVRIEVDASENMPHCTSGGTYVVRGDGQTICLGPESMLEIFLNREGERFFRRFEGATQRVEENLRVFEQRLEHVKEALGSSEERLSRLVEESTSLAALATQNAMDSAEQADLAVQGARQAANEAEAARDDVGKLAADVEHLVQEWKAERDVERQDRKDVYLWLTEIGHKVGLSPQDVYEKDLRSTLRSQGRIFGSALIEASGGSLSAVREALSRVSENSRFNVLSKSRRAELVDEVCAELGTASTSSSEPP